jgi:hypothetical protein
MELSRRSWMIGGAVALGAAIAAYAFWPRGTAEEKIRARMGSLAAIGTFSPDEATLARAGRVRGLVDESFTADATIELQELGESRRGRPEITALALSLGAMYSTLTVRWTSMRIEIDPSGETAGAYAVAKLEGARPAQDGQRDERDVRVNLVRDGGAWRVRAVVVPRPTDR